MISPRRCEPSAKSLRPTRRTIIPRVWPWRSKALRGIFTSFCGTKSTDCRVVPRNAFRHAQARRVEAEIHYDEHQLRVRIRDDGRGMNEQVLTEKGRTGHWVLRGMHERAKLVGGRLAVWSRLTLWYGN